MNKGFTLIELLTVVIILGVLATIALPQYQKAVEHARAAEPLSVMNYFQRMAQMEITAGTLKGQGYGEEDKSLCAPWLRTFGFETTGDGDGFAFKSDHFLYSIRDCMHNLVSLEIARNDTATKYPPENYQESLYDLSLEVRKEGFKVRSSWGCSGQKFPEACRWFNN